MLAAVPRWELQEPEMREVSLNTRSVLIHFLWHASKPPNAGDGGQGAGTVEPTSVLAVLMLLGTHHFVKSLEFKC